MSSLVWGSRVAVAFASKGFGNHAEGKLVNNFALDEGGSVAEVYSERRAASEVVGDYLDTFEEEPDGWGYYRYMAAMLVLIALPNLIGGPGSDTVASLWEFTRRFADHVDWDLGRAQGQHPATPELSFRRREGVVWLRNAELARAGGNTTVIAAESAAWGRTFVAALDTIGRS
ncbi:hypothetical protein [Actinacidiphila acidipaludis]|uniref:Uncharacterized protein n=1 Tax=Actinacidiphila acidipaludis TaxID=2873382 RepID=A0ABS7Q513_9ACTN|nr:hypothetical protein [Streptomyces acidipaludis]MBY8876854.1 hypothetical protein [Streptomyces acidipaludis]